LKDEYFEPTLMPSLSLRGNAILAEKSIERMDRTVYGSGNSVISSYFWLGTIMLLGGTFVAFIYRKRFSYTPIPDIPMHKIEHW